MLLFLSVFLDMLQEHEQINELFLIDWRNPLAEVHTDINETHNSKKSKTWLLLVMVVSDVCSPAVTSTESIKYTGKRNLRPIALCY